MGAQNALMIKKESIVHTKSTVPTSNYDAVKETTQPRQFDLNSDLSNLDDKALKDFEKLEKEKNKKSKASTEEKLVDNNQNNDKQNYNVEIVIKKYENLLFSEKTIFELNKVIFILNNEEQKY